MSDTSEPDHPAGRPGEPRIDAAEQALRDAAAIVEAAEDEVVRRRAHGIAVHEATWFAMEAAAMPVDEEFDGPDR
ncbi:MAG: hypothetical protein ACXIVQ_07205 [Acidimicrobiales bacterium]